MPQILPEVSYDLRCPVKTRPRPGTRRPKIQGIYSITNITTGECYIGSTTTFCSRWSHHKYLLKKGESQSPKLQKAWDYYGESAFICYIIEVVEDKDRLTAREQFHIDAITPEYNSIHTANRTPVRQILSDVSINAKFWEKVEKTEIGCWAWLGTTANRNGTTPNLTFCWRTERVSARRYAYEATKGNIPEDSVILNTCDNVLCVNPDHQKVVPRNRTFCKHGHEYTPENTAFQQCGNYRTRYCKECGRIKARIQHHRNKAF